MAGSAKANTAGAWCSPRPELCVFSSLEDARSDSAGALAVSTFSNGCIWDNDQTSINGLSGWRSDRDGEQQGRLARSPSSWPSWMLFHPPLWLIQNQLSRPNGPVASLQDFACMQGGLGGDQATTNNLIFEVINSLIKLLH